MRFISTNLYIHFFLPIDNDGCGGAAGGGRN